MQESCRKPPVAGAAGEPPAQAVHLQPERGEVADYVSDAASADLRAGADYRRQVARGLLKRLWLETRTTAPLAQTSVWASANL